MENYNHQKVEKKWQETWKKNSPFAASNTSKKEKRYILDMYPYPSGDGLHVGHIEGYTATDIYSRYLRLKGYNVMHPMGWDSFGLPAENYAVETGIHPSETTQKAISNFRKQMRSLGLSYDWDREIDTSDPAYYKWTQWFFLLLYKNGLAYKKKAKVNWCDSCQTTLANEQAEDGKCERCHNPVTQKELRQWFFKITNFIEDQEYKSRKIKGLISGLDDIDWPKSTAIAQKNWIGKSQGSLVNFGIKLEKARQAEKNYILEVYTTRPDTLFGSTYMVVCPEHDLLKKYNEEIKNTKEVRFYAEEAINKTELERTDLNKDKTGIKIEGLTAINPVNNKEIPIFVADYVLAEYGTGAIMAVPAHDQRDWEFAKKYNIEIIEVVKGGEVNKEAYEGEGININSEFLDGLETKEAKERIIERLEEKKLGRKKINYKIRDWLVSRQRYWGAPIPIVYCDLCGEIPVEEKDLPVYLPTDVDFKPTGESPLINSRSFHNITCSRCGSKAKRESDTMDTFVCSSWYYLRFADPQNDFQLANKDLIKKWLPVDVYVGGAEHAVLHLLYSRFFTKVLQRYGYIEFNEPFLKLRHQGLILAEDSSKMSKSKGNTINPDKIIKAHGADSLRMYEMFMGPLEDVKTWNTKGIIGIKRFLDKTWNLSGRVKKTAKLKNQEAENLFHKTIKKVTEDMESFKFNTAISSMMIFVKEMEKEKQIPQDYFSTFLILLNPFAPHITEELWEKLGNKKSITHESWPKYDKKLAKDETIDLVVQVNGKLRDTIKASADISEAEAKKLATESKKIKKWLENKKIAKIIFVKGRLVNIVIAN